MMSKIITITGFGILGIVSLLGIYLVSTHPIVSQHIGKATAIIIFLIIIFVLYILDRRDINAKWNLFTKDLDGNKTNLDWLNEKRRHLYNAQHTNIFRSRLQKRMLNECEVSIEKLKIEQSIDSQIQELKSKITYLENENDSLKQVQSSSNIKLNETTFSKIDFYKII